MALDPSARMALPRSVAGGDRGHWLHILLLVALGLGVTFRCSRLGFKIYSHDEAYTSLGAAGYLEQEVLASIWTGERLTAADIHRFQQPAAARSAFDVVANLAQWQPHQAPLFFIFAHYWMRLVGHSPAAMRGLATLFGLLAIPGMYWFSRELFQSRNTTLLATALTALSPFHILFAQDARPYSLFTLLVLLSSAVLLRALRTSRTGDWFIYALTVVAGMYTQQLFAWVAIVHGSYVVTAGRGKSTLVSFSCASLGALLAYLPWAYSLIVHWPAASLSWLDEGASWDKYVPRWALIFASPFVDVKFRHGRALCVTLRVLLIGILAAALLRLVRRTPLKVSAFLFLLTVLPAAALILPDIILGGGQPLLRGAILRPDQHRHDPGRGAFSV